MLVVLSFDSRLCFSCMIKLGKKEGESPFIPIDKQLEILVGYCFLVRCLAITFCVSK